MTYLILFMHCCTLGHNKLSISVPLQFWWCYSCHILLPSSLFLLSSSVRVPLVLQVSFFPGEVHFDQIKIIIFCVIRLLHSYSVKTFSLNSSLWILLMLNCYNWLGFRAYIWITSCLLTRVVNKVCRQSWNSY